MPRPDEGTIHAWLDGELSADEAARVARLAEQNPEWRAAVAEARGLIAASSRIVRALDAVPGGVVPAKAPSARRAFRVRPWVGIAAGFVLVAGTAYVMRDTAQTAFAPTSPPATKAAKISGVAVAPTSPPSDQGRAPMLERVTPQATSPSARDAAAAPSADAGRGARGGSTAAAANASTLGAATSEVSGAIASAAPVQLADSARQDLRRAEEELRAQAKATAEPLVARAADRTAERTPERGALAQRARAEADRMTGRSAPAAALGASAPPPPSRVLEGCWLASAPLALAKLHRDLIIVRVAGDSLELRITATETVVVVREGDALRGGLTALRTECPAAP